MTSNRMLYLYHNDVRFKTWIDSVALAGSQAGFTPEYVANFLESFYSIMDMPLPDELLACIHEFNGDVPDLIGEFTPKYEALKAERDALAAKLAAAREVLAFYAKHDNWVDPMPPVIWDGGYKAREALAALDDQAGALLPWPTDHDTPAHCPHCGVHVGPNGVCNEHGPQYEPMKGAGDV